MTLILLVTLFHPGGAGPIFGGAGIADNLPFFATLGQLKAFGGMSGGGGGGTPANGYVAEDGTTSYVAEDGSTFYVQE